MNAGLFGQRYGQQAACMSATAGRRLLGRPKGLGQHDGGSHGGNGRASATRKAALKAVCRPGRGVGARGCAPSCRRDCRGDRVRGCCAGASLEAWRRIAGSRPPPPAGPGPGRGRQGRQRGQLASGQRGRVLRPREGVVRRDVALASDENGTAPEAAGRNCVKDATSGSSQSTGSQQQSQAPPN